MISIFGEILLSLQLIHHMVRFIVRFTILPEMYLSVVLHAVGPALGRLDYASFSQQSLMKVLVQG